MLKLPTLVLLAAVTSTSQAFSFVSTKSLVKQSSFTYQQQVQVNLASTQPPRFSFNLKSAETEDSAESSSSSSSDKVEEVEAELTDDEPTTKGDEESADDKEEEEEKEPEEDPEITAIKKEISDLESSLKAKNRELNSIERLAEDYTKAGYARKVAEMESFRRTKSMASADNEKAAIATVLTDFLPILHKLQEINAQYEGDEFAKSYKALSWDFNNGLKDLGVSEYTVKEGDKADTTRVVAASEEYSDTVPKGIIISPVEIGYELEGNIMRLASAVVSLGPEPKEEESSEEADEGDESPETEASKED